MNFMLCIGVHRARFNAFEDFVRIQDARLFDLRSRGSVLMHGSNEQDKDNSQRAATNSLLRFWECPCEGTEGLLAAYNASPILRLASLFKETEELK